MTNAADYTLDEGFSGNGALGLVVLQTDETIESEFRPAFSKCDTALHITRVASGVELGLESIDHMGAALPAAVKLLPPNVVYNKVGYACTSGTSVIGQQKVGDILRAGCQTRAVTDPLSAMIDAMHTLGARNIGLLSPYREEVGRVLHKTIENAGLTIQATLSFGEEVEANVARITPASIMHGAEQIATSSGLDAIFLSCTNLRTFTIIDALEDRLQMPVLSSNQCLAWSLAKSVPAPSSVELPGRLGALLQE